MGEVIRKTAAAVDILADLRTTLTNARARGGDWLTAAESRLGEVVALADGVEARLKTAETEAAPLAAALDVENASADKLLGRVSDDIWNMVGRPGADPVLDILFPGGFAFYADGSTEEQPDRMTLLAELLRAGIHPRLTAEKAEAFAVEIGQAATRLEERVAAARPARARVKLAQRMQTTLARHAQVALSRLKAQWKADGRTEAEIHAVIPDRPTRGGGGGGGDEDVAT